MAGLVQDLRYAARQLRRSPGFFAAAILLIALGIAANTVIFTLVDAILLRPLPVRDPQNLVQVVRIVSKRAEGPYFDYPFYQEIARSSSTLSDAMGQIEITAALERGTAADRVYADCATENFFSELGVRPLIGRVLERGDDHVAVLSYEYWARAFDRDPKALGQTIRLKDHAYQIVGVAPEEFSGTVLDSGPDLWVPYANILDFSGAPQPSIANQSTEIIARLRPGASLAQAQQEMAARWTRYADGEAARNPKLYANRVPDQMQVRSIAHGVSPLRKQSQSALVLLLAGTGLLLLMLCANIGGLLLARATSREKEIAVRLAVGASRGRIFRQWLTESLLLTSIGGAIGVALAYASMPLLLRAMPPARGIGINSLDLRTLSLDLHPDVRVIGFIIAACALTTLLSALAPAWRASRYDLNAALKTTMSDRRNRHFQSALCALQVALCTVLLISAGLMVRTLSDLRSLNPGFDRDHVVIFQIDPSVLGFNVQRTSDLQRRLIDGARALPGVDDAAVANSPLMRGMGVATMVVFPGGLADGLNTSMNIVTPEYFDVLGMHILAGRGFNEVDKEEAGKIAKVIVNETFVRRFLKGQNPIGKEFAQGREFTKPQFEIIGVVNNSKYRSLREVSPAIYYTYGFPGGFVLHVRTYGDPHSIIQPMRKLLHSLDPAVSFYQVDTLSEEVDRSLWQERLMVALASCFGIFAMLLSAIGIYGILAYFVAGCRREIGLRIALGAESGDVIWLVSKRVIPTLAAGILTGVGLSYFAGIWVRSLLYGVQPFDPRSIGLALLLVIAIAIGASAAPAIRAMRVDPAVTLRED